MQIDSVKRWLSPSARCEEFPGLNKKSSNNEIFRKTINAELRLDRAERLEAKSELAFEISLKSTIRPSFMLVVPHICYICIQKVWT